ncbi:MAG: NADH-quinone oxidoreductase subunit N [Flavobacterium sp.]|jgi:NADH-quinone oxidoreductase subunit N
MNTLLAVVGLGIFILVLEIINFRKGIVPFTVIGLLAILGLTVSEFNSPASYYNNMVVVDKFSVAFSSLFIVLTIFLVTLGHDVYKDNQQKISDFISIKVFLLSGSVAMVSFGNLAMFFLGIEILSIALYVLAASNRLDLKSNEAGMKYFLMGSFASGFLLFGICLIYGATGYFDTTEIAILSQGAGLPVWYGIGIVLLLIGMLFKIAAAPFHFWAPDVYQGSPAITTATMSTLAKVVAMAALFKLLRILDPELNYGFEIVIVVVSILSMTVGNLMALKQTNVKRMLAFSGISHAGFMLMAILSLSSSSSTLLYYTAAYALAGITSFAVILFVCKDKNNEDIVNFNGLGKSHPILAVALTFALLSMAGIPIFAGFFAKFMLFTVTIKSGYLVVVIFAVVNSIISIGYYFKLIIAMFTQEASQTKEIITNPTVYYLVAIVAILLNIIIGLNPNLLTGLLAV